VHPSCPVWKSLGECDPKNNRDVPLYCPKTCGKCGDEDDEDDDDDDSTADNDDDPSCTDEHENCSGWAVGLVDFLRPVFMSESSQDNNYCGMTNFFSMFFWFSKDMGECDKNPK
jgi:hypothetical protein